VNRPVFRHLLVPVDGSVESMAVLPLARHLAVAGHGEMRLLQVAPNEAAVPSAEAHLHRLAREVSSGGVAVQTVVRVGEPAEVIVGEASIGTDLIIMSTHARWGLSRALLGSVAEHVLAYSPVPVVLDRFDAQAPIPVRRLLVPLDGSHEAELALRAAIGLSRAIGAEILLLQVVPLLAASRQAHPRTALENATAYVEALAGRLCRDGLPARAAVRLGDPAPTIGEAAEDEHADMIVMSTRALRGAERFRLGSTADEVVRTARRPVLLMRRGLTSDIVHTPVVSASTGT
jgi:nucleotide-binding universal stress UspA family protein